MINYDEMGWLLEIPNLQSLRFTHGVGWPIVWVRVFMMTSKN